MGIHATRGRGWVFLAAGLLLWGCGGGGGGGGEGENTLGAGNNPISGNIHVTDHSPKDQAVQVPLDGKVSITFDSPIVPLSFSSGQVTVQPTGKPPLIGNFTLDPSHKVLTFTPLEPFEESTDYLVTVKTLVYDTHYRTLARDYTFTFRSLDQDPPTLVSLIPGPESTSVNPKAVMIASFSERLDPKTVNESTVFLRDASGAKVPGEVKLEGDRVYFIPLADMEGGARYTFFIRGKEQGVKDRSGNPLARDQRLSFSTGFDTTPPRVQTACPPSGSRGVSPRASFRVTFDDSLAPESLTSETVVLVGEGGAPVPAVLGTTPDLRTLLVKPAVDLDENSDYVILLAGGDEGILNRSGVALAGSYHVSFRTGPSDEAPRVLSHVPARGETKAAVNMVPRVVFDQPMYAPSFTSETVTLSGEDGASLEAALALSPDGTVLTVTPSSRFEPGKTYTLTIEGGDMGVLSRTFRPLDSDLELSFTTTEDSVVPTVTLYPENGTNQVPTNTTFVALFSEPVQPSTVNSATVLLKDLSTGAALEGDLSLEQDGRVARFRPVQALSPGKSLVFQVLGGPDGVKDLDGNWLSGTAQSSVVTGYQGDRTPPVVSITLNEISPEMNQGLQVAPFGFTIDVSAFDPADAAVDPTSLRLTIQGTGSFYPSGEKLFRYARAKAQDQVVVTVPPSLPLAPGTVTIQASLADLSGNRGLPVSIECTVGALTPEARPLERNQVVFVDFRTDREGRGHGDGKADWLQDLEDYGLISAGDPIGKNAWMADLVEAAILAKANELYGRNPDGTPKESGSVSIRFVREQPPPGIPYIHMAFGGQDPEAGKRTLGQESTGVLGRAWYDFKNRNFADNDAGTSPGLGIFPGELFLYQANLYNQLYPGYITTFGKRFALLSPLLGGTPVGKNSLDAKVLDPEFDFDKATAAERSRYLTIFRAADDLAVALATILAHEVGHSLGLVAPGPPPGGLWGDQTLHVDKARPEDIMNAVVGYDALVEEIYRFRPLNMAYLRERILIK